MSDFCETYNLENLVKEPTCFKNPNNPSCIDLILTNKKQRFIHTQVIETGISDHHKLTVTMMRMYFKKAKPKIVTYRCYKNFNEENFRMELRNNLDIEQLEYKYFEEIFLRTLDKHAPIKEKRLRSNEAPFMNKILKKSIMIRTRLRNKFLNNRTEENWANYKKQINYCLSLSKKEKKEYYNNLNVTLITDNRKFWNTVQPLFSDKIKKSQNIVLIENNTTITDEKEIANKINNFFSNAVHNLNIERDDTNLTNTEDITQLKDT